MAVILFDLDGTLLPMDQNLFVRTYFGLLGKKVAAYGYDPQAVISALGQGTYAMIKNDGSMTNETRFWRTFEDDMGPEVTKDRELFESFYANEFQQVKAACGCNPCASEVIGMLKQQGHRLILATNPLFPRIATCHRIRWAGLQPEDFELYTTYEDYSYCKPNPGYYLEILEKISELPENCIMVGNDAEDDLAAAELGMRVFLLTDCLINEKNKDISAFPQGGFKELQTYLSKQLGQGDRLV